MSTISATPQPPPPLMLSSNPQPPPPLSFLSLPRAISKNKQSHLDAIDVAKDEETSFQIEYVSPSIPMSERKAWNDLRDCIEQTEINKTPSKKNKPDKTPKVQFAMGPSTMFEYSPVLILSEVQEIVSED